MPILTKEVKVIPMGTAIQHYRNKGYDAKHKQLLTVKVEDLPKYSDAQVKVLCDFCYKNTMIVKYGHYNRRIDNTGSYVCKDCSRDKANQTNLQKYGTSYPIQLESFQEKRRQTNLERFGVENYAQTKECREKMELTSKEKYGVPNYSQTEEFKRRYHDTCIERYGKDYKQQFTQKAFQTFYEKTGYNYPSQSPEIKEKIRQTSFDRYGAEISLKSPEVRKKAAQTYYSNSSKIASKQQQYLCSLYEGILNFPIKYYNIDICLPDDNLVIEFDGGGHFLDVVTGRQTMEEHKRKEIIRYSVIKKEGYKQMRIISKTDRLPDDQILLQMLKEAKQYFNTTSHNWMDFDIDNSKMINAENKEFDGVFYNFGKLHAIKDIA